jgi:hypothetical protein
MNESRSRLSSLICSASSTRLLALFALTLMAWGARPALAQDADAEAIAKATQLNKEAVQAYQAHKTDDAKRLLRQALDLCDASGLSQHPIKARTLVHFGIVLIGGSHQRELGIKQFRKALEIQAEIGLTKALVTPELQQAFDEAKRGDKPEPAKAEPKPDKPEGLGDDATEEAAPAPTAPAPEPPPPSTPPAAVEPSEPAVPSTGLDHEPVTHAKPNTAISITVNVDAGLKFDKIVLAYRPNGAADYLGRELKQVDPGIYSAEIPQRATSGTLVAYYLEAQDQNGDPVAARGSADKPLVIMLGEPRVAKKSAKGDEDGDDDGDDDDDENGSKFFVGLLVGSGAGYASGNGDNDLATQYSSGGIALAKAIQISPELGYWIRPDLMLSLQIRYQIVTGPTGFKDSSGTFHHPANFALAAFAKATWMLGHGRLRPLLSLALGGGQIRHVVTHPTLKNCGQDQHTDCIDTIAAGPVLAGGGAGIMYSLTPRFALLAVANAQIGAPDFTFNLDANIGAAVGF